ncbi:hypothetical protein, partial [Segatella sp.]|uniref:hypothetical protein n=1 Tax=Segatella sp. TaxID=2974253 RepID=UPI00307A56F6
MKTWMCALMLALSTGASANFNPDGTIQKVIPTLRGVGLTNARSRIQIINTNTLALQRRITVN